MVFALIAVTAVAIVGAVLALVGVPNVHTEAAKQAVAADSRQKSLSALWGLGRSAGPTSAATAGPSCCSDSGLAAVEDEEPKAKKPKAAAKR